MIIFASYGYRSPIVAQKLNDIIKNKDLKIGIVPYAAQTEKLVGEGEKKAMVENGFKETNICIIDKFVDDFSDFDYVYVAPGDTFKLWHDLTKNKQIAELIDFVRKKGNYIGISAGAYIACNDFEYARLLEDNNYSFADFEGLGIVDGRVICHCDVHGISEIMAVSDGYEKPVYKIDNTEAFVFDTKSYI